MANEGGIKEVLQKEEAWGYDDQMRVAFSPLPPKDVGPERFVFRFGRKLFLFFFFRFEDLSLFSSFSSNSKQKEGPKSRILVEHLFEVRNCNVERPNFKSGIE